MHFLKKSISFKSKLNTFCLGWTKEIQKEEKVEAT